MTDIEYDVIYTAPDGRLCAAVFTPGQGADFNEAGDVQVGYLVDGQFVDYDQTEMAWIAPEALVATEKMNGIDEAPVIDIADLRARKAER